ncbi:MAG: Ryanodine receptor Ryr [Erysipelotrichaceae bacterium]|nr:Ryanodine receptor Ryr [Erysipelotrichaceae bacterium]
MKKYYPDPINTSNIQLDKNILEIAEILAKNTHEVWSLGKIKEGWTYGPKIDSNLKQHPSLIEYEELSEEQKDYDRNTSIETLKVLISLGFKITK